MDKRHLKKIKRNKKKKKEKKLASEQQQRLAKQINMFDRLPKKCTACNEDFPKTREAHMTWKVAVENESKTDRLFCPRCQQLAIKKAEEQR